MKELIHLSTRLVVMSQKGAALLKDVYKAPPGKIDLIPHGFPTPFHGFDNYKDLFGVEGKLVAPDFGLLSPSKGIENM